MHLWGQKGKMPGVAGRAGGAREGGPAPQGLSYRIRCPPGSLRRQFTKPTTPEVGQSVAVSHTGWEEDSARILCRTKKDQPLGGSHDRARKGPQPQGLTFRESTHW